LVDENMSNLAKIESLEEELREFKKWRADHLRECALKD
jgi:hypothetical protein